MDITIRVEQKPTRTLGRRTRNGWWKVNSVGALGASRGRIVRQLLAEVLLLAACGCVPGIALAGAARDAIAALLAGTNVGRIDLRVDERVLLFAAAVSIACGSTAGLFPALRMSWIAPVEALKQGGALTSSTAASRLKAMLVSGQVALSLAIMAGAGMLLKGGWQIWHNDPGFPTEHLLTMNIPQPGGSAAAVDDILDRIRSVPGIEGAGMTQLLPLSGGMPRPVQFYIAGRPRPEASQAPAAGMLTITDGYFQTIGVPVRAGRLFDRRDTASSLPVAVVNASLAALVTGGAFIFVIQSILLVFIAALASWLPVWRAMRVDPCAALRAE